MASFLLFSVQKASPRPKRKRRGGQGGALQQPAPMQQPAPVTSPQGDTSPTSISSNQSDDSITVAAARNAEARQLRQLMAAGHIDVRAMRLPPTKHKAPSKQQALVQPGPALSPAHVSSGSGISPSQALVSPPPVPEATSPHPAGEIRLADLLAATQQGTENAFNTPYTSEGATRTGAASSSAPHPFRYSKLHPPDVQRALLLLGLAAELPLLSLAAHGPPALDAARMREAISGSAAVTDRFTTAVVGGLSTVQDAVQFGGEAVAGAVGTAVVTSVEGVLGGFSKLWSISKQGASAVKSAATTALATGRTIVKGGEGGAGGGRPQAKGPGADPWGDEDDEEGDDLSRDADWLHARQAQLLAAGATSAPPAAAAPSPPPDTPGSRTSTPKPHKSLSFQPASPSASLAELQSALMQVRLLQAFEGQPLAAAIWAHASRTYKGHFRTSRLVAEVGLMLVNALPVQAERGPGIQYGGAMNDAVPVALPRPAAAWSTVKTYRQYKLAATITHAQIAQLRGGVPPPPGQLRTSFSWAAPDAFPSQGAYDKWAQARLPMLQARAQKYESVLSALAPLVGRITAARKARHASHVNPPSAVEEAIPCMSVFKCCGSKGGGTTVQQAEQQVQAERFESAANSSSAQRASSVVFKGVMGGPRAAAGGLQGDIVPLNTGAVDFDDDAQYLLPFMDAADEKLASKGVSWPRGGRLNSGDGALDTPEALVEQVDLQGGAFSNYMRWEDGSKVPLQCSSADPLQALQLGMRVLLQDAHYSAQRLLVADMNSPQDTTTAPYAWLSAPERGQRSEGSIVDVDSFTSDPPPGSEEAPPPVASAAAALKDGDVGGCPYILHALQGPHHLILHEMAAMHMLEPALLHVEELCMYLQQLPGALEQRLLAYHLHSAAGLQVDWDDGQPVRIVREVHLAPEATEGVCGPLLPLLDYGNVSHPANATAALYGMLLHMAKLLDAITVVVDQAHMPASDVSAAAGATAAAAASSPDSDGSDSDDDIGGTADTPFHGEADAHASFALPEYLLRRLRSVLGSMVQVLYTASMRWTTLFPAALQTSTRVAEYLGTVDAFLSDLSDDTAPLPANPTHCDRSLSLLLMLFRGAWGLHCKLGADVRVSDIKASALLKAAVVGPESLFVDGVGGSWTAPLLKDTTLLRGVQRKGRFLQYPPFLLMLTSAIVDGARMDYKRLRNEAAMSHSSGATPPAGGSALWALEQAAERTGAPMGGAERAQGDSRLTLASITVELPANAWDGPSKISLVNSTASSVDTITVRTAGTFAAWGVRDGDDIICIRDVPISDLLPSSSDAKAAGAAGATAAVPSAFLGAQGSTATHGAAQAITDAVHELLCFGSVSKRAMSVLLSIWRAAGQSMPPELMEALTKRSGGVSLVLQRACTVHTAKFLGMQRKFKTELPSHLELFVRVLPAAAAARNLAPPYAVTVRRASTGEVLVEQDTVWAHGAFLKMLVPRDVTNETLTLQLQSAEPDQDVVPSVLPQFLGDAGERGRSLSRLSLATTKVDTRPTLAEVDIHIDYTQGNVLSNCENSVRTRNDRASGIACAEVGVGYTMASLKANTPGPTAKSPAALRRDLMLDALGPVFSNIDAFHVPVGHAAAEFRRLGADPFVYAFEAAVAPDVQCMRMSNALRDRTGPAAQLLHTLSGYLWNSVGNSLPAGLRPSEAFSLSAVDTKDITAVAMDPLAPSDAVSAALCLGLLVEELVHVQPFLASYRKHRNGRYDASAQAWMPAVRSAVSYACVTADLSRSEHTTLDQSVALAVFNQPSGLYFKMRQLEQHARAAPGLLSDAWLWPPEEWSAGVGAMGRPKPMDMGLVQPLQRLSSKRMLLERVIGQELAEGEHNDLGIPVLHLDDFFDAFVPGWVNAVYARMLGICDNASKRDEQSQYVTAETADGGKAPVNAPRRLYSAASQWLPTFLHQYIVAFSQLPHAGKWKNLSMFANRVLIGSIGSFVQNQTECVSQVIKLGNKDKDSALWEFFRMQYAEAEPQPVSMQALAAATRLIVHLNNILFARESLVTLLHVLEGLIDDTAGTSISSSVGGTMSRIHAQLMQDRAVDEQEAASKHLRRVPAYSLHCNLVRGENLEDADFGLNKSDPYAILSLTSGAVADEEGTDRFLGSLRTQTHPNTLNPKFNFTANLLADGPAAALHIHVLDEDAGEDDSLGSTTLPLAPLLNQGAVDCVLSLRHCGEVEPGSDTVLLREEGLPTGAPAEGTWDALTAECRERLATMCKAANFGALQAAWGHDVIRVSASSNATAEKREHFNSALLPSLMRHFCDPCPVPRDIMQDGVSKAAAVATAMANKGMYGKHFKKWNAARTPHGKLHLSLSFSETDASSQMFQHMSDLLMQSLGRFMALFHDLNRPCIIEMVPADDAIEMAPGSAAYARQVAAYARPFLEAIDERILVLEEECAYPALVRTMLLCAWEGFCVELSHLLLPDVPVDTEVTKPSRPDVRRASAKRVRGGFLGLGSKMQTAYLQQRQVDFARSLYEFMASCIIGMEFQLSQDVLDASSAGLSKTLPLRRGSTAVQAVETVATNSVRTAQTILAQHGLQADIRNVAFPADSNLHGTTVGHYVSVLTWHDEVLGRKAAKEALKRVTAMLKAK